MTRAASRALVPALSITLITSWGSLYYAFAVLDRPIQAELDWSAEATVGAYSLALLVWGLCTYPVGRVIDRHGGRAVMTAGSCLAGVLLLALSQTTALWAFYAIWCGLGVAMAATLYEPAFAVMVAAYPGAYRRRIGILTLTGGLASTAFWPLTHVLVTQYGWRGALLMLGAIHLFLCAPLHSLALPRSVAGGHANHAPTAERTAAPGFRPGPASFQRNASFWLMAFCFMAFGFVTAAMALHVIPLLESRGATPAAAIALAALIGPMQSSGRITEVLFGARVPALALGAFTVLLIPAALVALLFGGATTLWFYIFVIVYGAGLGLITIVRATTPVEIFGRDRYASISGALGGPAIMARCVGPFAATALLTASQDYDSVLTLMLAVAAAGAASYWLAAARRQTITGVNP